MYLLIRSRARTSYLLQRYLHPTMYLLIPSKTAILIIIVQRFTSHYVSINSNPITALNIQVYNLHPTMYLLIRQIQSRLMLFSLYLHPTMYLLILFLFTIHCYIQLHLHPTMYLLILTLQRQGIQVSVFTSHYVSINSL